MTITVRYFAALREALGPLETLEWAALADPHPTVGRLRRQLAERDAAHLAVLGPDRLVRAAVNHQMVTDDAPLFDGAEVGFFPPVTGG